MIKFFSVSGDRFGLFETICHIHDVIAFPKYFYLIMGICSVVSVCVLIFFAKRHRNPRLRPKPGEVILVGVILFMGSGFFSHFTSEL